MITLATRYMLGIACLMLALLQSQGWIRWPGPTGSLHSMRWPFFALAGTAVFLHAAVDSVIAIHAKSWRLTKQTGAKKESNELEVPRYQMENMRLLSSSLIVSSGVIIGLAKNRNTGSVRLDTFFLATGIIFGFINLSVHGGSVHKEIDRKVTKQTCEDKTEDTLKLTIVEDFHDRISRLLLNSQFIALILGIAALV